MGILTDAAKSANHCQRNWSNRLVEEDIVQELIGVATNMPTKQNEEYYGLLVTTDPEFNHTTYMHSYAVLDDVMKLPFERRHLTNYNTQLRAPLQFHYLVETGKKFQHGYLEQAGFFSIGISAGAVALAAASLGLKTGFCVCLDHKPIVEIVNQEFNTTYNGIVLSIGIGYPEEDLAWNVGRRPNGDTFVKPSYTKNIKIFRK